MGELVRKAAGLSSSLLRTTVNRSPEFMITIFITHIKPIMDFYSTVWNVGYARDLAFLEGVQRKWTKNIDGMQDLSYGESSKFLNVFSIEARLLHTDFITYWKILCSDSVGFDLSRLFQRSVEERTLGHWFKLVMPLCNTKVNRRFLMGVVLEYRIDCLVRLFILFLC